jgi:hypothetical protein
MKNRKPAQSSEKNSVLVLFLEKTMDQIKLS